MRLIFADTETGGLDPSQHPILTVGLAVWEDGVIGDSTELKLYANPSECTPEALRVNGIDLAQHNEAAIRPATAGALEILRWCRAHWSPSDGQRIRLGGHNVAFDVGFLRSLIGAGPYWRQFHHRPICTMTLLPYLWMAGRLPSDVGKLGEACAAVGVEFDQTAAHSALYDALASARLYTRLLEIIR